MVEQDVAMSGLYLLHTVDVASHIIHFLGLAAGTLIYVQDLAMYCGLIDGLISWRASVELYQTIHGNERCMALDQTLPSLSRFYLEQIRSANDF